MPARSSGCPLARRQLGPCRPSCQPSGCGRLDSCLHGMDAGTCFFTAEDGSGFGVRLATPHVLPRPRSLVDDRLIQDGTPSCPLASSPEFKMVRLHAPSPHRLNSRWYAGKAMSDVPRPQPCTRGATQGSVTTNLNSEIMLSFIFIGRPKCHWHG